MLQKGGETVKVSLRKAFKAIDPFPAVRIYADRRVDIVCALCYNSSEGEGR